MAYLSNKQKDVLSFVEYELTGMLALPRSGVPVRAADLDDPYLMQLTEDQREELGVKLIDLALWIHKLK